MTPKRIQRKRTKGWRMPEGAVYVGRPSRWGNPWEIVAEPRTAWDRATPYGVWSVKNGVRVTLGSFVNVERARYWAVQGFWRDFDGDVTPLRGHDLVCWCPISQPCHADVLLELANSPLRDSGVDPAAVPVPPSGAVVPGSTPDPRERVTRHEDAAQ